ncbi:MFS transporter [Duganella sp. PWIR1]
MDEKRISGTPMLWVPSAYFSMGLSYAVLNIAMAVMFKNLGMENGKAAEYASYFILAYTVKPLFSPLVEMYRTKKFFVLMAQVLIGLTFLAVASLLPLPGYMGVIMALLWMTSFLGATQDIATDGVYISALSGRAQSLFCGVQSLSWNLAPILVTGGLVYLSGFLHSHVFGHDPAVAGPAWGDAWQVILYIIAGVALLLPGWHRLVMPAGARAANAPAGLADAAHIMKDSFVTLFQKRDIGRMIALALLFPVSVGLLEKIGPFFMVDPVARGGLGLTNEALGLIYGTFGLGAVLVGALLGGLFAARRGLQSGLMTMACAVNIPNVTFLLMAWFQPGDQWWVIAGVVVEKFFYGFGHVALTIYLMQQLAPGKYSTTHYAFGTGLKGLCMLLTGIASGHLQEMMGYVNYFIFVMAATIPSFIVAWLAPFHNSDAHARQSSAVKQEALA